MLSLFPAAMQYLDPVDYREILRRGTAGMYTVAYVQISSKKLNIKKGLRNHYGQVSNLPKC